MVMHTKKGTIIKGDRIIAEARKISDVRVIVKSGRHKAQRITLKDNAMCYIDKKTKIYKVILLLTSYCQTTIKLLIYIISIKF